MRHNHCSQSLHLPNPAYAHSVISLSIFQSYRRVRRGTLTRLLCFLLIFNLLLLPGSAITLAEAVRLASKAGSLFTDPFQSAAHLFLSRRVKSPRQLETVVSRTSRVASIEISPRKLVGYQGLRISFTAIGLDSQGSAVQGAKLNWASSDSTSLQIDDSGQATLIKPGLVWVTVSTPFVQARAPVLIKPGLKPHQTDPEWDADQSLLRFDGTIIGSADGAPADLRGLLAAMPDAVVATPLPQSGGGDSGDFLYDELWSEPRNLVGSPRNRAMTSCAVGSILPEGSNFELSIPLWGLPGRGLPLSLSLNYNSRVWSRHSSAVTFNAVNTWPYLTAPRGQDLAAAALERLLLGFSTSTNFTSLKRNANFGSCFINSSVFSRSAAYCISPHRQQTPARPFLSPVELRLAVTPHLACSCRHPQGVGHHRCCPQHRQLQITLQPNAASIPNRTGFPSCLEIRSLFPSALHTNSPLRGHSDQLGRWL